MTDVLVTLCVGNDIKNYLLLYRFNNETSEFHLCQELNRL